MNTHAAESRLEDYLLNGVAKEIFFADEAKSLVVEIGNSADLLNAQGFGHLFGSLQTAYSDRQTLCVTKMFDPESQRNPTRSIPAILNLIEYNASVWLLPQKHILHKTLIANGHNRQHIESLNNTHLSLATVTYFRSTLPQVERTMTCSLSRSLKALREARDKVIAHNEAIPQDARTYPTWGDAEALITYAKVFVVTISFGFLNLYMGEDADSYHPSLDAQGTTIALTRMLKKANLIQAR